MDQVLVSWSVSWYQSLGSTWVTPNSREGYCTINSKTVLSYIIHLNLIAVNYSLLVHQLWVVVITAWRGTIQCYNQVLLCIIDLNLLAVSAPVEQDRVILLVVPSNVIIITVNTLTQDPVLAWVTRTVNVSPGCMGYCDNTVFCADTPPHQSVTVLPLDSQISCCWWKLGHNKAPISQDKITNAIRYLVLVGWFCHLYITLAFGG